MRDILREAHQGPVARRMGQAIAALAGKAEHVLVGVQRVTENPAAPRAAARHSRFVKSAEPAPCPCQSSATEIPNSTHWSRDQARNVLRQQSSSHRPYRPRPPRRNGCLRRCGASARTRNAAAHGSHPGNGCSGCAPTGLRSSGASGSTSPGSTKRMVSAAPVRSRRTSANWRSSRGCSGVMAVVLRPGPEIRPARTACSLPRRSIDQVTPMSCSSRSFQRANSRRARERSCQVRSVSRALRKKPYS